MNEKATLKKPVKFYSAIVTIVIIFSVVVMCKEVYSFAIYSTGLRDNLPPILNIPQNHLNAVVFLLCFWLIFFFHYVQKGNDRALHVLAIIFGGILLHFWYGKSVHALGSVYFYLPGGVSQILFYFDVVLFAWIVGRLVWRESDED